MVEHTRHDGRAQHARRGSVGGRTIALMVAVALIGVGLVSGYVLGRVQPRPPTPAPTLTAGSIPSSPAASASPAVGPPGHPTMIGDVTRVVTGDEVVVQSGGTDLTVRVLGLDTPNPMPQAPGSTAACGSRDALEFADSRLSNQTVTLVPDPTQPETDDQGRHLAYVVLRSQLNYTDDALRNGIGRADTSRPLWYADVFASEQRAASDAERGIWGAPCHASNR